jgi:hypothetical protein
MFSAFHFCSHVERTPYTSAYSMLRAHGYQTEKRWCLASLYAAQCVFRRLNMTIPPEPMSTSRLIF